MGIALAALGAGGCGDGDQGSATPTRCHRCNTAEPADADPASGGRAACIAGPTTSHESALDPRGCNPWELGEDCAEDASGFTCALRDLWGTCGSWETLSQLLGAPIESDEQLVLALFPETAERPWFLSAPAIPEMPLLFSTQGYPPYEVSLPVDWLADPNDNNTWRLYFQGLRWLTELKGDAAEVRNLTDSMLIDWAANVQMAEPAFEWTWGDHAMSMRLEAVMTLADRAIDGAAVLSLDAFAAMARLIVTHLYALASTPCYSPGMNHGVMEDLALMTAASRLEHLPDAGALWDHASTRFLEQQLPQSVSSEGVHLEHSPNYHLLFATWLPRLIHLYLEAGRELPTELRRKVPAMLRVMTHLLQPNQSFPQFGATGNGSRASMILDLVASLAELPEEYSGELRGALNELRYSATGGLEGTEPTELDAVYPIGGYASFRSGWSGPAADSVSAHLRSGKHSQAHYHADETTFEIFGFGEELIIDTGSYSYDSSDPFHAFQSHPRAHNLLTLDDAAFDEAGGSGISASGSDGNLSWVHAYHGHYRSLGCSDVTRTFAFDKPRHFLIVDSLTCPDDHEFIEHVHLSPRLSEVTREGNATVAQAAEAGFPSLTIVALDEPDSVESLRGVREGEVQGFTFRGFHVSEENTDVTLRYRRGPGGETTLGYLILLNRPGEAPTIPWDVRFDLKPRAQNGERYSVSWSAGDGEHALEAPAP